MNFTSLKKGDILVCIEAVSGSLYMPLLQEHLYIVDCDYPRVGRGTLIRLRDMDCERFANRFVLLDTSEVAKVVFEDGA